MCQEVLLKALACISVEFVGFFVWLSRWMPHRVTWQSTQNWIECDSDGIEMDAVRLSRRTRDTRRSWDVTPISGDEKSVWRDTLHGWRVQHPVRRTGPVG